MPLKWMIHYNHDMVIKRLPIDTVPFAHGYNLIDIIVSPGQLRVKWKVLAEHVQMVKHSKMIYNCAFISHLFLTDLRQVLNAKTESVSDYLKQSKYFLTWKKKNLAKGSFRLYLKLSLVLWFSNWNHLSPCALDRPLFVLLCSVIT